jgi:hypothetical protein
MINGSYVAHVGLDNDRPMEVKGEKNYRWRYQCVDFVHWESRDYERQNETDSANEILSSR